MLRVLLGFLIAVAHVLGSPQRQGSLQETFQALQNLQQQQSQQGSQGSNGPGSGSGATYPSDPNFGSSGNRRPSTSAGDGSTVDPFDGPGFGGANAGSAASNNEQRPASGASQQQGFDAFNGPAAQASAANSGRPGANQQGFGAGSQLATTVRSPLNVVSNENTIPEASCVRRCIAVSTYDPVCGSDDITYTNRAKFRCAQNCGRRVNEAYRGACVTTPSPN